jgi:hypothetical protein
MVCAHGALSRSCLLCECEERIRELESALEAARGGTRHAIEDRNAVEKARKRAYEAGHDDGYSEAKASYECRAEKAERDRDEAVRAIDAKCEVCCWYKKRQRECEHARYSLKKCPLYPYRPTTEEEPAPHDKA